MTLWDHASFSYHSIIQSQIKRDNKFNYLKENTETSDIKITKYLQIS